MKRMAFVGALASLACLAADEAKFSKVNIDFSSPAGRIKPMHAVNNAPLRIGRTLKEFRIAGIPYMRTHDTMGMWGWGHFIDVPNIFPNFDADENDPKSYDFKFSDEFLMRTSAPSVMKMSTSRWMYALPQSTVVPAPVNSMRALSYMSAG